MSEKKQKKEVVGNQKSIIHINDYVRFINHAGSEFELQRKNDYTDGTDKWIFKGWFYTEDSLMKAARALVRDKKVKSKEEADLTYFIKCFREANQEIKKFFNI
jgi:hypothetical protein